MPSMRECALRDAADAVRLMLEPCAEPLPVDHLEALLETLERALRTGPTGEFTPNAKIPGDEGAIGIGVGSRDGLVIVDFGEKWVALRGAEANGLATLLHKHAQAAIFQESE